MSKIALITGASSGIGKATAKKLLKDGFIVYAAARRLKMMDDLSELGAKVIKMDVTDDASMTLGVKRIIEEQGQIDVLINNAGYALHGAVEDVPIDEVKRQLNVNVVGPARLIQLCTPYMREKRYGKIINVSSVAGKIYSPIGAWYYASKHAIEGMSDCLRLELKPFNIDVIIIEPGLIKTDILGITVKNAAEYSAKGAYKKMAVLIGEVLESIEKYGSKPEVIANTISKAIKARKPKARYAKGRLSKISLFAFKWLPDKLFDYIYYKQYLKRSK
jgi:NAD(P)-dependent dehydrogenase (short-subunit alcohol dehydrogenase family)